MKILFLDVGTSLTDIHELERTGRGGRVNSLFRIPDALSQQNNECYVISDIKQPGITEAGTHWLATGSESWVQAQKWDVFVMNRGMTDAYPEIEARHRILWTHDLPHTGFVPNPDTFKAISAVIFMSQYGMRVWRKVFKTITRRQSYIIPNGIDEELFYPRDAKDLNYLIYASAPNRGLKRVPLIYAAAKNRVKRDIYLKAYSSMEVLHPNENWRYGPLDRDEIADHWNVIYDQKDGEPQIELLKPLPQKQFAEELGKAGLMVLPTDYPEICSNVVLQSLASGTPIISTGHGIGSIEEWVKHGKNGMLTEYHPVDYMVHTIEMVRFIVDILENPKKHRQMIKNAVLSKGIYTWEQIGAMWQNLLNQLS